ncbi:hypothetical protein [Plesiomonas shigelloides]|uniref:hypothetical protein n=1 Tax=Plesiomonas shigelloides TaxID=703 RepID=UPI00111C0109|nr:hypothetical protein [Plesiomonas shigelloides]
MEQHGQSSPIGRLTYARKLISTALAYTQHGYFLFIVVVVADLKEKRCFFILIMCCASILNG